VSGSADSFMQRVWYDGEAPWLSVLLMPLSWLFRGVATARRSAYRSGWLRSYRVQRPVIVVGNITVGGTGKTPFTIWLAKHLQARGLRVGIVLRGYGGRSERWPREVTAQTSWEEVGDEAVLLAQRTGAIVVAGPDRVADARRAIELGADIVLSDDGLQHYRLARDCEIAVIDGKRGLGNARLLPAGPLREPAARLSEVDLRVLRGSQERVRELPSGAIGQVSITSILDEAVSLTTGERRRVESFTGTPVHAIAAIGHPAAFFASLTALGLEVQGRPLADHARLTRADISFDDRRPVLMTEKDAVKCRTIADERHWVVRMDVRMSAADEAAVSGIVGRLVGAGRPARSPTDTAG
jgi:tetraacyldisaccharide 4'-kinase